MVSKDDLLATQRITSLLKPPIMHVAPIHPYHCLAVLHYNCSCTCSKLTPYMYLSWSLEFCWLLPGGHFGVCIVEVCSSIRSLVFCPWGLFLQIVKLQEVTSLHKANTLKCNHIHNTQNYAQVIANIKRTYNFKFTVLKEQP